MPGKALSLHRHKHSSNQSPPIQILQEQMQKGKIHLREWQKGSGNSKPPEMGQDSAATSAKALSLLCKAAGGNKDFPAT